MSSTVCIGTPREIVRGTRMTPDGLRREPATHLFREGKLSLGKAREMVGVRVRVFQQLLGSRGIPAHYGVKEYEEDIATLKELGLP